MPIREAKEHYLKMLEREGRPLAMFLEVFPFGASYGRWTSRLLADAGRSGQSPERSTTTYSRSDDCICHLHALRSLGRASWVCYISVP